MSTSFKPVSLHLGCFNIKYPSFAVAFCGRLPKPSDQVMKFLQMFTTALGIALAIGSLIDIATGFVPTPPMQKVIPQICSQTAPALIGNETDFENFVPQLCYSDWMEGSSFVGSCYPLNATDVAVGETSAGGSFVATILAIIQIVAYMVIAAVIYLAFLRKLKTCRVLALTACCMCCCEKCMAKKLDTMHEKLQGFGFLWDIITLPLILIFSMIALGYAKSVSTSSYYVYHELQYRNNTLDLAACTKGSIGDSYAYFELAQFSSVNSITNITVMTSITVTMYDETETQEWVTDWEDTLNSAVFPGMLFLGLTVILICLDLYIKFWEVQLDKQIIPSPPVANVVVTPSMQPPNAIAMTPYNQPTYVQPTVSSN